MPGLNEIFNFIEKMQEKFQIKMKEFQLIPLHSSLSDQYKDDLFETKNSKCRKIIIATNIAESAITVPDVVYIIDYCLAKQV